MNKELFEAVVTRKVEWQSTQVPHIFESQKNGQTVQLRMNDFPEEPLCTLLISDQELDLEEFPKLWTLPGHRTGSR